MPSIDKPISSSDFINELARIKPQVWQQIKKYLPNKTPLKHYDMVRDYPARQGKYFRPALLLLGTELFGGNPDQALLLAAAMQTSEDWLLIHDDVEDQSPTRRGSKTLNKLHGDSLAINAGDVLHVLMWQMLYDYSLEVKPVQGKLIMKKMAEVLRTTMEGQFLELDWVQNGVVEISEEQYLEMIKHKTAWYTIIGPLQLGAIAAGAETADLNKLAQWGLLFGQLFQIWDDVIDLTETSDSLGKEHAGDIWEGKRTLILVHLLSQATKTQRTHISSIYLKKRKEKTSSEIKYILNLMHKYDSISYAKDRVRQLSQKAKAGLELHSRGLPGQRAARLLMEAIEFTGTRSR
jgi:geranylgeranyl diphosphate synthase type II